MASDACAPWLFADPYAYQYSDIATHERGLANNKIKTRCTVQELPAAVSSAGSTRFELDVPNSIRSTLQRQEATPRSELEVAPPATIIVTGATAVSATSPPLAAELDSWTAPGAPLLSPVELAGDGTFLAPQQRHQPQPRPARHNIARLGPTRPTPAPARKLTLNCPHHHTAGTACCEKIVYIPEEAGQWSARPALRTTASLPSVSSTRPASGGASVARATSPRPKSAVDFDSILANVNQENLLGWEKRQSERVRGKRYKDRFDSGN